MMTELIPVLQIAIGPVILISGVGLVLLSMTNRFGRVIDRSRIVAREVRTQQEPARDLAQLRILLRRGRLLRTAILLAVVSVLSAALLIILLFVFAFFRIEAAWVIAGLFVGCLLALIFSLLFFLSDINLSLVALKHELPEAQTSTAMDSQIAKAPLPLARGRGVGGEGAEASPTLTPSPRHSPPTTGEREN